MTITYSPQTDDFYQGSDSWRAARCGLLTASEVKHIITPTRLELAANDKLSSHLYELAAQRISKYVEPRFIGHDMVRGHEEEVYARMYYSDNFAPVTEMAFVTNDRHGFMFGCSPDGLVGDDGMTETKSRDQKFQIKTVCDWMPPPVFVIQLQSCLTVCDDRKWIDFLSYSNGLPMARIRVYPDAKIMNAIVECGGEFDRRVQNIVSTWRDRMERKKLDLVPTIRREPAEWV
jgi:hypothetical protein